MLNKKQQLIISIALLAYTTAANLVHPVTPEKNFLLGFSTLEFSLMFCFMSIGSFLGANFFGKLSDKYGRKKILMIGMLFYGVNQMFFGFSSNLYIILLFRILGGFFSGSAFVMLNALIIDYSSKEELTKIIARNAFLQTISQSIGYFIGGFVGRHYFLYAFFGQFTLILITIIFVLFTLKEPINKKIKSEVVKTKLPKPVYVLLFIILISSLATTMFSTSYQQFMKLTLDFDPLRIAYFMIFLGLINFIVNILVLPKIRTRIQDETLLKVSFILCAVFMSILLYRITYINSFFVMMLTIFLCFYVLYTPLSQSLIARHAQNNNGQIMGYRQASISLGNVFGSLIVGLVFDKSEFLNFSIIIFAFVVLFSLMFLYKRN